MPLLTRVTKRPVFGGHVVIARPRTSGLPDAGVTLPILSGDVPIVTLGAIQANGNPVMIVATLNVTILSDGDLTLKLFRQVIPAGAFTQISSTYIAGGILRAQSPLLFTAHWYDEPPQTTSGTEPSEVSPIYRVTAAAESEATGINTVLAVSHVTAHTN